MKLVVRNAGGADSIIQNQFITVYPNPVVDFTASDTSGCFPLPVQFSDLSISQTGSITNYSWDFGDGDTSSLSNPSHTYISAGNFSVILKVTNSYGCTKTFGKAKYIKINGRCKSQFYKYQSVAMHSACYINFTNTSTGPASLTIFLEFW